MQRLVSTTMCTQLFSRRITSELAVIRAQSARLRRFPFPPHGPHLARRGGRIPPLMAEVGQSIFHERIIGIVRFMEAKELRGAAGLQVWHGTCML